MVYCSGIFTHEKMKDYGAVFQKHTRAPLYHLKVGIGAIFYCTHPPPETIHLIYMCVIKWINSRLCTVYSRTQSCEEVLPLKNVVNDSSHVSQESFLDIFSRNVPKSHGSHAKLEFSLSPSRHPEINYIR